MRARARSTATAKDGKSAEKGPAAAAAARHSRRKSITATLAGALASTRACQRIIVRALGRDGVEFVRTLRHCVELQSGSSSTAKRFKSDVFKFLAQWIVYEKEGRFSPAQIGALQKPAMRVTLMIVVALHRHIKFDHMRSMGAFTARRHSDDARHARTRVRATRDKLEWMRARLSKVDDTLQQLSLEKEGSGHTPVDVDASESSSSSRPEASPEDAATAESGGPVADGVSAKEREQGRKAEEAIVDPVDEIIEMEDTLESLAASLTSIRADTSLWSELLQDGPPTGKTLGDSIRLFGLAFHALLSPMLERSDSDRLREMIDFASAADFLDAVLTKEVFAEHRAVLYRSLTQKDTNFGISSSTAVPPTPRTARGTTGNGSGTTCASSSAAAAAATAAASASTIDTEQPHSVVRKRSSLFGSLKHRERELSEISEELSSDSSDSSRRSSAASV